MELILARISLESCTNYQHSVCSVSCLSAQGPVGSRLQLGGQRRAENRGCWVSLRVKSGRLGGGRKSHRGVSSLWIYILSRGMNDFPCVVLSALTLLVNPYPLPFSGAGKLLTFCFVHVLFLEYAMGKGGAFSLKVNFMWFWGLSNLCGSIGEDSKSSFGGGLSLENIPEGTLRSFIFFHKLFILKTSLEVSPQAKARALHQKVEKLEDRWGMSYADKEPTMLTCWCFSGEPQAWQKQAWVQIHRLVLPPSGRSAELLQTCWQLSPPWSQQTCVEFFLYEWRQLG